MEQKWLSLTRFGAALLALISIVLLLWPPSGWDPDPGMIATAAATVLPWLLLEVYTFWQEFAHDRSAQKKDDAELFNGMSEIIGFNELYALRNQDLRSSFSKDGWAFIHEFFRFAESDLDKFHDKQLQRAYNRFKIAFKRFSANFGTRITLEDGVYRWKPKDVWLPEGTYKEKLEKIDALNNEADALADRWQELHGLARRKLAGHLNQSAPRENSN